MMKAKSTNKNKGYAVGVALGSADTRNLVYANRNHVMGVLRRAEMEALGDTEEVMSMDEVIEKYNPDMNTDEIRAWVHFKRSVGVPMTGWEKYYLKEDKANDAIIYVTTQECDIYDANGGEVVRVVPTGTELGVANNSQFANLVGFSDKQGRLWMVEGKCVRSRSRKYSPKQSELDALVKAGALFYDKGEYYPLAAYVYANTYDREQSLASQRQEIEERFGEAVFNKHLDAIMSARPKVVSFFAPSPDDRPQLTPVEQFSKEHIVYELSDTAPILIDEEHGTDLRSLYVEWLRSIATDAKRFRYVNVGSYTIINVYLNNARKKRGEDETQWNTIQSRAIEEGNRLFLVFIDECLSHKSKQILDISWNRIYNAYPNVMANKVPIGAPLSTVVNGQNFRLRDAQREGVAFMELNGSGCISFDVGVGKTFTAIAELACAMAQGKCRRPLVVVPNSVYANWIKEMFGDRGSNGLLSNTGITFNDWYNLGADISAKETDVADGSITLVTYEGMKHIGLSAHAGDRVIDDLTKILNQASQNANGKSAAKLEKRISNILGPQKTRKIDLDKCEFDYIVIDEAHRCKNIFSKVIADTQIIGSSKMSSGDPSEAGLRAFLLCNYIQYRYGNNVMLLTATPFTNAPLEIYSMLSLVALTNMRERGLLSLNTFWQMFVQQKFEEVVNAALDISYTWTVAHFKNRLILQGLIFSNFCYKTGLEANVKRPYKINIPHINSDGKRLPAQKQILSYLTMTDTQEENQEWINNQIRLIQAGSKKDSIFRYLAMSLNNAFSPFLFSKEQPASAEEFVLASPKIHYACECIRSVQQWHGTHHPDGASVLDLSRMSGQVIYSNRGKEYFPYIKEYLEDACGFRRGVEAKWETRKGKIRTVKFDEVTIVSGDDADKKSDIMRAFNEGLIHVLIGTATIREGVNLQKRATCLYNLYPEWNPTDIQQLEGRIWRQGNTFQFVRIVMPLMQDTMDTFIFQKIEEKTSRINDIWYRADRGNVLNVDSLDPEEVKFALVTDIDQLVKSQIVKDVAKIQMDINILVNERSSLKDFKRAYEIYNEKKEAVITDLRNSLSNAARYIPVLNKRPTEQEYKEMPASERAATKKLIERYDEIASFLLQANYDDKTLIAMSRKMQLVISTHTSWSADSFAAIIKKIVKIENDVLAPRGYNRDSNIDKAIDEINQELSSKKSEYEFAQSDSRYAELFEAIAKRKKESGIIGRSLSERLAEFERTNYLMAYVFNPNAVWKDNKLPAEGEALPLADGGIIEPTVTEEPDANSGDDDYELLLALADAQFELLAMEI